MSCSVSRNSLGTVVECAEGGENEPGGSAGVATSSRRVGESYEEEEDEGKKCARLTEQLILIEKQTKLEEEMTTGAARGDPSRVGPKTSTHGAAALRGDRSPRRGPFSISRLNLISFLNNIATPSAPVSRHPIARSAVRRRTTQEQPAPGRTAPSQPFSQSSRCARNGSSTSRSQSASITGSIVSSLGTSHEHPPKEKMSPRSADISVEVETESPPIANSSQCSRSVEDFGSKKISREDLGSDIGQGAAASQSPSQHGRRSIAGSIISAPDGVIGSSMMKQKLRECPICTDRIPAADFPKLTNCGHRPCALCLVKYLRLCIMESRTMITCPECHEFIHVADIYALLTDYPSLLDRYECFSLRRALSLDPDTRWCPAPDCPYAVVAHSCAACPQLQCERPGCGASFCYHCKGFWHHNQTCDQARQGYLRELLEVVNQRHRREAMSDADGIETEPGGGSRRRLRRDLMTGTTDVMKACPRCGALIVKMNDGSCNHMVCALCGVEFCWLCLKQINELHYLSPTGCTFWGKKPWTRKKKLLWQIGTLIGAPLGIALIAGLAVPGIICGVPIFVGRKTYQRFSRLSKTKRHLVTAVSVLGSLIVSPVLAVMAVGVGVPIMLAYVYGVVPLSLCRDGGCGSGRGDDGGLTTEGAYGEEDDAEFVFLTSNTSEAHERSHLLHSMRLIGGERLLERPPPGTNTNFTNDAATSTGDGDGDGDGVPEGKIRPRGEHSVTGIIKKASNNMGTSNDVLDSSTSTGRRHNRQQSTESGLNSLGERVNTEDASVKAIAGSHYNYDDSRSVHTIWSSGLGAASYNEDSASTMACGGSVLESRSLAESGSCTLAHHSTPTNATISGSASTGGIMSLPPPCHTEMLSCSSRMERDVSPGSNVRFASTPMQLPLRSSPPAEHHWQRAESVGSMAKRSQADTPSTTVGVERCDKESAPIVRAVGKKERSSAKKGLFRRPLASFFSSNSQSAKSGPNKREIVEAGKQ